MTFPSQCSPFTKLPQLEWVMLIAMSYFGFLYPHDTGLDMHKLWSTACARQ